MRGLFPQYQYGQLSVSRLIRQSLLFLSVTLLLLTTPLAAQTDRATAQATAQRLLNEGLSLVNNGSKESLQQAARKLEEARLLFHTLNDGLNEAVALLAAGMLRNSLGEKQQALAYYAQALPLFHAAGERGGEALLLNNIGSIHYDLGEQRQALEYFLKALPLARAAGEGEALTLFHLGKAYQALGENRTGLDYYNQALPLYRAAGEHDDEAYCLNNVGVLYWSLGESRQGLVSLQQALTIFRAVKDRKGEAQSLVNLGLVYNTLGERQQALDSFNQAVPLARAAGDRGIEAAALNYIGGIYSGLSEHGKAFEYFFQALTLAGAAGERTQIATALSGIALIYDAAGEKRQTLDYYERALPLLRAAGERAGEMLLLNNIGRVYDDLGERQKALTYFNQALSLARAIGDRNGETLVLINVGYLYKEMGDDRKALDYYNQALPLARVIGNHGFEAAALVNIAFTERDLGRFSMALAHSEASVALIESLRTKISSQALRSSFFATAQDYYELYIGLLMRLHAEHPGEGYDGRALQASERARARSLLETLAEANADIRQGVDPNTVKRERELQRRLNAKAEEQLTARGEEETQAVAEEIETILTDLEQVEAQIHQNSPRYAALTQPVPLSLREIQTQALDSDTVLLEYSLGRSRSYLWVVTPTAMTGYELPKRAEIETAAAQFRELLATPNRIYLETDQKQPVAASKPDVLLQEKAETATRLSRMLLGPVASQLGRKRLVIVADGALQYLPFAALPDPASLNQDVGNMQPLIAQHEVVSLPSISVLATLRSELAGRQPALKEIAALADPVFSADDERVNRNSGRRRSSRRQTPPVEGGTLIPKAGGVMRETRARRGGDRLARLEGTRKEAQGILALVPANKAKAALDFDASRALAVSGELSQYRYILFATHGRLDGLHPELSSIVLSLVDESGNSQDGYLRLNEVYNLKLLADVVTLSGCETGLGKEISGEGLVGLTRGFMYAGAARVVVSLWKVDDEATSELMVRFYRGMLREGKRSADALRQAQIEMMKQKQWQSPHYWAAFVLQGEWK